MMKKDFKAQLIAIGSVLLFNHPTLANEKKPNPFSNGSTSALESTAQSQTSKLKPKHLELTQSLKASSMQTESKSIAIQKRLQGPGSSGGGNALVCFKTAKAVNEIKNNGGYISDEFLSQINFIETFDLYEAKKPRGFKESFESIENKLIPIIDQESVSDYAKRIIGRLKIHYPETHDKFMAELNMISGLRTIMTEDRIDQVYDINPGDYVDKPNCLYATLAAQSNSSRMTSVYIDKKLFNHPLHSRQSKGVLMIHEAIYSLLRKEFDHKESRVARFIVSALLTNDIFVSDLSAIFESVKNKNGDYLSYSSHYFHFRNLNNSILRKYFGFTNSHDGHAAIGGRADSSGLQAYAVVDKKTITYRGTSFEECVQVAKNSFESARQQMRTIENYISQALLEDYQKTFLLIDTDHVVNSIKSSPRILEGDTVYPRADKCFPVISTRPLVYQGSWTFYLVFDENKFNNEVPLANKMKLPAIQ